MYALQQLLPRTCKLHRVDYPTNQEVVPTHMIRRQTSATAADVLHV